MKILAISGHAGHGKDTAADLIRQRLEQEGRHVLVVHFADLLKHICRSFFGWNGEKDPSGRELLQYVGTDVIRASHPDFWVDFIISILELFHSTWDDVLIPDARFPNEIERLREEGFSVLHLRVLRPGYQSKLSPQQQKHASETALDHAQPDYTLLNQGTMDTLQHSVGDFMEVYLHEKR